MITASLALFVTLSGPANDIRSMAPLPNSPLTEGFVASRLAQRFARQGPEDYVPAVLSEDGHTVWCWSGTSYFHARENGWYAFSLPGGGTPGRELVNFAYYPEDRRVVAFTTSQSKLLMPRIMRHLEKTPVNRRDRFALTAVSADIVLALGRRDIVAVTSETPQRNGALTFVAAARIDTAARGANPTRAAFLAKAMHNRGPRIALKREGRMLTVVEAIYGRVAAYTYDFARNRIVDSSRRFKLPTSSGGVSVRPRRYDFNSRRAFYDFMTQADRKADIWSEWDAAAGRWRRFAPPPGQAGPAFYARGRLYAETWRAGNRCSLYRASNDRKRWYLVGPYLVHARDGSGRRLLVERTTDHRFFLAALR